MNVIPACDRTMDADDNAYEGNHVSRDKIAHNLLLAVCAVQFHVFGYRWFLWIYIYAFIEDDRRLSMPRATLNGFNAP